MAEQFYTILTNVGKAKIANALPTGTKVNLTKMKIGDSNGTYYNPSESQTELVHKVYECNVTSVEVDESNPNWITITAAIPSDVGGFSIREVGVFDDSNSLIAIGKYPETYKPVASDGSVKELYIKMTLEVVNASSVELKIDPTIILATKKDIANINTKVEDVTTQLEQNMNDINLAKNVGINVLCFDGSDDTEKFQNALNSEYDTLLVPEITVVRPLTIPYNKGKRIIGIGGLKRTAIRVNLDNNYSDRAIFEYLTNSLNEHNWSGVTFENIHLIGNNSEISGIKLQYVCYPLFNNVLIEGFNGSGLILDKCQDGSFNNLIIQLCGRSIGNGYVNSETTHAPLEILSTMSGDNNNMLRFNDLQIEQNNVSPYIRIKDQPLCLWFDKCHFEVRSGDIIKNHDLCEINGGDIYFNNSHLSPTFRNGFIYDGYGNLVFENCRSLNNIIMNNDGMESSLKIINCGVDDITLKSAKGFNVISKSTVAKIDMSYPSGNYDISDCIINEIVVSNRGDNPRIYVDNIICDKLTFNEGASSLLVKNSVFNKEVSFLGGGGEFINNTCNGTLNINSVDNMFVKKNKEVYTEQRIVYGGWNKGDKMYITSATNTGDVYCYLCVKNGNMNGYWDDNLFKPIITIN